MPLCMPLCQRALQLETHAEPRITTCTLLGQGALAVRCPSPRSSCCEACPRLGHIGVTTSASRPLVHLPQATPGATCRRLPHCHNKWTVALPEPTIHLLCCCAPSRRLLLVQRAAGCRTAITNGLSHYLSGNPLCCCAPSRRLLLVQRAAGCACHQPLLKTHAPASLPLTACRRLLLVQHAAGCHTAMTPTCCRLP
jgi:hypothetical protein